VAQGPDRAKSFRDGLSGGRRDFLPLITVNYLCFPFSEDAKFQIPLGVLLDIPDQAIQILAEAF